MTLGDAWTSIPTVRLTLREMSICVVPVIRPGRLVKKTGLQVAARPCYEPTSFFRDVSLHKIYAPHMERLPCLRGKLHSRPGLGHEAR